MLLVKTKKISLLFKKAVKCKSKLPVIKQLLKSFALKSPTVIKWNLQLKLGKFYGDTVTQHHIDLFESLSNEDIYIDLGANVGKFSFLGAIKGSEVHSFEPNRFAFEKLNKNLGAWQNVKLYRMAASTFQGKGKLYLHENSNDDPIKLSTASTLLSEKNNIDGQNYHEVSLIDIAKFIKGIDRNIRLLKMDIEGAEVDIIPHLIETKTIDKIENLLIELHDNKNSSLKFKTNSLKKMLKKVDKTNVFLDWH